MGCTINIMDIETQQRAISGIITSFEDVSSLRGQEDVAQRVRPYLQGSFKEPGSFLHRLLEANPGVANQWMRYESVPSSMRRQIISQSINSKTWEDAIPIGYQSFLFLAELYKDKGITAAEAEKLVKKAYEDALNNVTLDELVTLHDNVSKNDIRDALGRLKLSTGNVAGASIRLKFELDDRYGPEYEQDLKIALWECSQGNNNMMAEIQQAIEGTPARSQQEQIVLFARILTGKESELLRATLLKMIGKTIADLPGISDAIREERRREGRKGTIPLDENCLEQIERERFERTRENSEMKINLNSLTPRELEVWNQEKERILADKTREEWYGLEKAERVKQQIKYMKSKYS
jgi:hypothetical protein